MSESWPLTRLKFIAEIDPVERADTLADDDLVSFLPMEAIGEDGSVDLSRTRPLASVKEGYTGCRDGDVVVAKITPCFENGKGALLSGLENGVAFGTTELFVLRSSRTILPRYLYYLTLSHHFRKPAASQMYGAGGQKRVPSAFVRDFEVKLPPLPQQRTIAGCLDRETAGIDLLIRHKQQLISLSREELGAITDSVLSKVRGSERPLKRHVELVAGYAFPSDGFLHTSDDGVRLLRGINVGVGAIRWADTVWWPVEHVGEAREYELEAGDIVFGMDRPWIAEGTRVAFVTAHDLPALLLQRVARLRACNGLTQAFLFLLLMSRRFRGYFECDLTGVSVPHISPEQIGSFRFVLPPEERQREICRTVEQAQSAISRKTSALMRSLQLLLEYRSALITAAVTGQIDVRALDSTPRRSTDAYGSGSAVFSSSTVT